MNNLIERTVEIDKIAHAMNLFGNYDENIRIIEGAFNVKVIMSDKGIRIVGYADETEKAEAVIRRLILLAEKGDIITKQNTSYLVQLAEENQLERVNDYSVDYVCLTAKGRQIKSKTHGQKRYIDAINKNTIVFGIGPAGTGKTFLAVAMTVTAFKNKEVDRIIITRPAVEAGEKLGFLPGDFIEKVNPYLRPLYDGLFDILGLDVTQRYMEKNIIEVAPMAYMRGRTLNDAFIILDEAQNTTPQQMKMFLTRLGFGSRAVITGDITQVDLPKEEFSGLIEIQKILKGIEGISFNYLNREDVVRHPLVQRIIDAYEEYETAEPEDSRAKD